MYQSLISCVHLYSKDVTILVKRYSADLKTISIMGKKSEISYILKIFEEQIKVKTYANINICL